MKRLLLVLSTVVVLSLLAACGPAQPETVTVVETVVVKEEVTVVETVEVEKEVEVIKEVEKEVIKEVEVEKIVEVEAPSEPEGDLIVTVSTFPNSLYVPNAAERNAINVSWQIQVGLTWQNDEGEIVPMLAESWEPNDDGTEWIFHLREGVTFHNGEPFKAQDVVTTWEAGKDPVNAYAYQYEEIENVEVIDDLTVKVILPDPDPLFLLKMGSDFGMIPTDYFNEVGTEGIEEHVIGAGPFMLSEWVKGDKIILEAFPDYWKENTPKVARVIYRPIPESATRIAAAQTGEVHIANRFTSEEAAKLLGDPNVNIVSYPISRIYYIAFNNLSTGIGQPTEDPKVRLAMNYAVDRQAIVDALFEGHATLADGWIGPDELGHDDSLGPYPYDPELAKEMLAEAGYPDGFEIGMACPVGAYPNFEQVCEAIGGYFSEVGIEMEGGEIQFMESGQYWDLEAAKELPPLFGDAWSVTESEALVRLQGGLQADASYAAWAEPTIDDLLARIATTIDDGERAALYTELHNYMYENPPFIYLYLPKTFEAVNSRVQNYKPRFAEHYFLFDVFIASSN